MPAPKPRRHPRTGENPLVLWTSLLAGLVATPAYTQEWSEAEQLALLASAVVGPEVIVALADRDVVDVVVVYAPPASTGRADSIVSPLSDGEFVLRHRFRRLPALAGTITRAGLVALAGDARVVRIDLERGGGGSLGQAVPLAGLDTLHSQGFGGAGITVAILDTGADLDHTDLVDSIVGEQCFCTSCCPGGSSQASGPGSAEDDNGHGTNVTGIITSNGAVSSVGGSPDADVVLVKVLDFDNNFCCSSDVLAGLDWIIDQRPDVDVVNLSLGTSTLYAGDCDAADATTMAYAAAIDTLRSSGVLVLAASGNNGSATLMAAPACVAGAIASAASNDLDEVWGPSNTNTSTDLFAPGVDIQSTGPLDGTLTLTGTSQASAMSAACAAVLVQAVPTATVGEIEAAMTGSTTILVDPKNALAIPRLDCAESLTLLPEPAPRLLAAVVLLVLAVLTRSKGFE